MLIAIEGIDGVGKTTIGKALAKKLKFSFSEKELLNIWDTSYEEYVSLRNALKTTNNTEVMSMFFCLINLLCGIKGISKNVVADRYIATTYFWYGTEKNECIYDAILSLLEKPILTVVLKASADTLISRIITKEVENKRDTELEKIKKNDEFVPKTKAFLERKGLEYIIVDNDNAQIEDVVNIIINKLKIILDEKYDIMSLPEVKAELEPYYKAFKDILTQGRD